MAATASSALLDQDDSVTVAMVDALAGALALLPSDSQRLTVEPRGEHASAEVHRHSAAALHWPHTALSLTDEIMHAMLEHVEAARSSMNASDTQHPDDASSDSDGDFSGRGGRALTAEPLAARWLSAAESAAARPRDRDRTVFGDRSRPLLSASSTTTLDDTQAAAMARALARSRLALDLGLDSSDGSSSD
jgi:hypothetical protein